MLGDKDLKCEHVGDIADLDSHILGDLVSKTGRETVQSVKRHKSWFGLFFSSLFSSGERGASAEILGKVLRQPHTKQRVAHILGLAATESVAGELRAQAQQVFQSSCGCLYLQAEESGPAIAVLQQKCSAARGWRENTMDFCFFLLLPSKERMLFSAWSIRYTSHSRARFFSRPCLPPWQGDTKH